MSTCTDVDELEKALEADLPCTACENPAFWLLRCKCCKDAGLMCHAHKRKMIEYLDSLRGVYCESCKQWGVTWEVIIEVLPI